MSNLSLSDIIAALVLVIAIVVMIGFFSMSAPLVGGLVIALAIAIILRGRA